MTKMIALLTLLILSINLHAGTANYDTIGGFDYGADAAEIQQYDVEDENVTLVNIDIRTVNELVGSQLDLYHSDLVRNFGELDPKAEKLYKIYRENTDIVIGFIHLFFLSNTEENYVGMSITGGITHLDTLGNVTKFYTLTTEE